MIAAHKRLYTEAEYLDYDRDSDIRNELVSGEIIAMAGADPVHVAIVDNITYVLRARLRGGPCRGYALDLRTRVDETGLYAYPDVVVVCGAPRYAPTDPPSLLNPTVIFEVLSPSTERYDRGEKFAHYRRCASLREYVLVSVARPRVEHYRRGDNGQWVLTERTGEESVELPALGIELPLVAIYEDIDKVRAELARARD